jgi:hypothetical protein
MNRAKDRYRLQRKLQSALTRVVEVLAHFEGEDLKPNGASKLLMAGLFDLLQPHMNPLSDHVPRREEFDRHVIDKTLAEIERRRKETDRRYGRQGKRPAVIYLPGPAPAATPPDDELAGREPPRRKRGG